jgi:hypothetical protein
MEGFELSLIPDKEAPHLALALHLKFAGLRSGKYWFSKELGNSWSLLFENNHYRIYKRDAFTYHSLKALNMLLDDGQLPAVFELITDSCAFSFDSAILERLHALHPCAVKISLASPSIKLEGKFIGELADWVIGHFTHEDPAIFVRFLTQREKDPDTILKVVNHVPEVLGCLDDGSVKTDSELIVRVFLLHGMACKLHRSSFEKAGLTKEGLRWITPKPKSALPKDPVRWVIKKKQIPEQLRETLGPDFLTDYDFYSTSSRKFHSTTVETLTNIKRLQRLYKNDPRKVIAAVVFSFVEWEVSLTSAKWYVSKFNASHLTLFERIFRFSESAMVADCILQHAPNLLFYTEDWSVTNPHLVDVLIARGMGYKLLPEPGMGEDYAKEVKVQDYIQMQRRKNYLLEETLELILDYRYPITPRELAYIFYQNQDWSGTDDYLLTQTPEYQKEYEACREFLSMVTYSY